MRADGRIGGASQLLQDVRHLVVGQGVVGLHRRVTGHGRRDSFDRVFDSGSTIEPFEIFGERPQRGIALISPQHGGVR